MNNFPHQIFISFCSQMLRFSFRFWQPALKSNNGVLAPSRRPLWPRLAAGEKQKCMTVVMVLDKAPVHWCGSGGEGAPQSSGLCSADDCLPSPGPHRHVPFQSKTTDTMAAIYFSDRAIYGPSLLIMSGERKIAQLPPQKCNSPAADSAHGGGAQMRSGHVGARSYTGPAISCVDLISFAACILSDV